MQIGNLGSQETFWPLLFFTLQLSFDLSDYRGLLGPDIPKARFNISLDLFCELLLTVFIVLSLCFLLTCWFMILFVVLHLEKTYTSDF